jgi:ArsR family transcriptional regulator
MQAKVSKKKSMSDAQIEEASILFGILAEASRLRILRALMEKPLTVTALVGATGMKQGNVSKHLGLLLSSRFVAREREGNFIRYRITDRRLFALCELMCARIDQDARQRLEQLASPA